LTNTNYTICQIFLRQNFLTCIRSAGVCSDYVFVAPLQFARYAAKMKPFEFSQVNFATSDIWLLRVILQVTIPAIRHHMVLEVLKKSIM